MKLLPLGIQTFEKIIDKDMVYVDKTDLIYNLVKMDYIFLSRPRRFGKSLLVSTLKSYFEGRKDLFKGFAIENLEKDWTQYPVVALSFAGCKTKDVDGMAKYVSIILSELEVQFGLKNVVEKSDDKDKPDMNFNARLKAIIDAAQRQYNQKVVVLIDEYDALMLNVVDDWETQDKVRTFMNNLFSPLKDLDPQLRFVFITGITKLSQMSIFSVLNNLTDISLSPDYATICGITDEEVKTTLKEHVSEFAKKKDCTFDEMLQGLKMRYDGYHFSSDEKGVFNPYSLFRALSDKFFRNYWFETATPSALIALLKNDDVLQITELESISLVNEYFDAPIERVDNLIPFLYQAGYLTIKGYDEDYDTYTIGFPNREVRYGFSETLLRKYAVTGNGIENTRFRRAVVDAVKQDNPELLLQHLKDFLMKIPYPNAAETPEWYYQNLLYAILATSGLNVMSEIRTSVGRIDFVIDSPKSFFLFEFKLNKSAEEAFNQIDNKFYEKRFSFEGKHVWKIGANFSSAVRNLDGWKIEG